MGRILILLSVALVAFHAQCVAACSLLPCGETTQHSTPAPEPPCHHQVPAPVETHDAQACGHSQFVSEDGVRMVAPAMDIATFELVVLPVIVEPSLAPVEEFSATSPPPPLLSASLSRAVLRV